MRPNLLLIPILLFFLVSTASALDVFGTPLKYTAGLEPSTHVLSIVNDGESTILLSENLKDICDFNPRILKRSGQFTISCAPTAPISGYLQVVPPTINSIRTGVQIPVVLGDQNATPQTKKIQKVPTTEPTVPEPEPQSGDRPAFGLSLSYLIGLIITLVIGGSGIYLLWIRRYD